MTKRKKEMHEEDITKYINENACHKKFVNYINSQINRNWLAKNKYS